MRERDGSRLRRPRHEMPDFVREALMASGLMPRYLERPPYQQNDYIGWITQARRDDTRQKRLQQMLDELARGDVYMKMPWRPSASGRA
ncbi:YdeI/OmpD-associated family protein [Geochorda subterranea]|uniref:YdeI/OmpD-associated family protein n=1 Tax=Geochorda subterranea TaxID=3109564 RepID=A0ABZ1BLP9_9FIRM|nr:YdeI/OmpD-associated family protein [Limnochorda sp. LNt]WRP13749.1 YdeI/OmpD-associated family protein [Limnochorda sp. LNt]